MRSTKKVLISLVAVFTAMAMVAPAAFSQDKIGYVDLRRAFYEYEKSKTFDAELNEITTGRNKKRNEMVQEITKMREKVEMLSDEQKAQATKEIDAKIAELNEFDKQTRQELLNEKNDMFREIIEDIQEIVEEMGQQDGYDYILDSRNIMYARDTHDLTDQVLDKLNQ